jgi:hypothetical protein
MVIGVVVAQRVGSASMVMGEQGGVMTNYRGEFSAVVEEEAQTEYLDLEEAEGRDHGLVVEVERTPFVHLGKEAVHQILTGAGEVHREVFSEVEGVVADQGLQD